jgi:hypothetical protein
VVHAVAPDAGDKTTVWILNVLVKLPLTLLLLLLVYRFSELIEPRTGLLAAFALGACTLVLPFTTLFFSHVSAAATGFAAFVLLFDEPEGKPRLRRIAVAGVLAGLTCIIEYPSVIVALALAIYVVRRGPRARRLLAYAAGGLVGITPLLAYNWSTFGSPFRLSYKYAVGFGDDPAGAHAHGLFGITQPSLRVTAELLLQNRGLLTTTPIVAAGIAGAILLARRGMRAEGLLFAGIGIAFLVYNAGVTTPFGGPYGGASPGPRYLIGALPFALAAIGLAYRRSRGTVVALMLVSVTTMALATATSPEITDDEIFRWAKEARHGLFSETVVAKLHGPMGIVSILPFAVLLILALALTLLTLPGGAPRRADILDAVSALLAWLVAAWLIRALVVPTASLRSATLALAALALIVASHVAVVRRTRPSAQCSTVLSSGESTARRSSAASSADV